MFVFPMVGLSSRFFKAGYTVPKYELPLGGMPVFAHVVRSFEGYFECDHFRFVCRADHGAERFIEGQLGSLGVANYSIVVLASDTRGQAETVYHGTRDVSDDEELFIFNIDTFRPGYRKPPFLGGCDGYLEVFHGDGEHWSFVGPGDDNRVLRTTEKQRISALCSDGLYYFRRKSDFDGAFTSAVRDNATQQGEYYVAPLYNRLIAEGKLIKYDVVPRGEVVLCGTPAEYEACLALR